MMVGSVEGGSLMVCCFVCKLTAATEIYPLAMHVAIPIWVRYVTFGPGLGSTPVGQGDADGGQHHPENEGQPESLDGLVSGPAVLAGTAQPGHGGRRSVGQEHAEAIAEHQEARRHPQPGQRRCAQMAYHRRVG